MIMRNEPDAASLGRVKAALEAESFPKTREELYYAIGDLELDDGQGHAVAVRDVLDGVQASQFEKVDDAVTALCEGFTGRSLPEQPEPLTRPD